MLIKIMIPFHIKILKIGTMINISPLNVQVKGSNPYYNLSTLIQVM
jgi:hypothetical protein